MSAEIKSALEVSYHICDFIETSDGKIYLLEFGNAITNSNFKVRDALNKVDTLAKILSHVSSSEGLNLGPILYETHSKRVLKNYAEMDNDYPGEVVNTEKPHTIVINGGLYETPEYIQEQFAAKKEGLNFFKPQGLLLDAAPDMVFICDMNKRILNKVLELGNVSFLQPKTWVFDGSKDELPSIPTDLQYLIIKPDNSSRAEGLLLVQRKDLDKILLAIKTRNPRVLSYDQQILYAKYLEYYSMSNNHRNTILIQEFCPGRLVSEKDHKFRVTGRAVFAVVKENNALKICMVDLFWQFPLEPMANDSKLARTNCISDYPDELHELSRNPQFNCCPSVTTEDRAVLEPKLVKALHQAFTCVYQFDVKQYLQQLVDTKQESEIRFFLSYCGHFRVNRLDKEFIELIFKVDGSLAKTFLLEQAKRYTLAHHIRFPQKILNQWLKDNISLLNPEERLDLKKFFDNQIESMREHVNQEYMQYVTEFLGLIFNYRTAPGKPVAFTDFYEREPCGKYSPKPVKLQSFTVMAVGTTAPLLPNVDSQTSTDSSANVKSASAVKQTPV